MSFKISAVFVIISAFAIASAMVPFNRFQRAIPEDSVINQDYVSEKTSSMNATTTSTTPAPPHREICARQTPCAWTMYQPITRIINFNITNPYCICGAGLECLRTEDDTSTNTYVYRCRTEAEVEDLVWDS